MAITGAARIPFLNKTYEGSEDYSQVESSQLPMVDWICLFVLTLYMTLCIVLNCIIPPTNLFQPLQATCLPWRFSLGQTIKVEKRY